MTSAAFVRIMDRSIIQERLAETKERIANGESQIAQQRRLIAELETNGSPASHAKYLLAGLKLLQTARRDSRDWLLKRLKSVYRRRFQRRGGQFQVPGMGPPFTADAPVDTSTPVAKALAAKQAITDFGNMDPPPSPPFIGKMGRASPLSTGRDACFIVRDTNGQTFAYLYFEDEPRPGARRPSCSRATRRDASPPTSPS